MKNQKRNSIKDNLCSMIKDAEFVRYFSSLFPGYPILPNRRAGCWLFPAYSDSNSPSVYFKSTDGHFGKWDFNIRRMNLHLLDIIKSEGGCIIVDVTKRGKRFPDSFAKTIPIWCAVLNRVISKSRVTSSASFDEWDTAFNCLPSIVSESERLQIEEILESVLVEKCKRGIPSIETVAHGLEKPLRPLWFSPESRLVPEMLPNWSDCPFYPVILLSASKMVQSGDDTHRILNYHGSSIEYDYIQGAADDTEAWSQGCSIADVWSNMDQLLDCDTDDEITCLLRVLKHESCVDGSLPRKSLSQLGATGIFIGDWSTVSLETYSTFDIVINCTQDVPSCISLPQTCDSSFFHETTLLHAPQSSSSSASSCTDKCSTRYLQFHIPEGKKGQRILGNSIPILLERASDLLATNKTKKILVHCRQGIDRSVGLALCLLLKIFREEWEESCDSFSQATNKSYDKMSIRKALAWLQTHRPCANPSSATMKQIHLYFMPQSHEK